MPTSLSSPISLGRWFGDKLACATVAEKTAEPEVNVASPAPSPVPSTVSLPPVEPDIPVPAISPPMQETPTQTAKPKVEPVEIEPIVPLPTPALSLSWQGILFVLWLIVAAAMDLLLIQRAVFVRSLIAQAGEADDLMLRMLGNCAIHIRVRKKVGLKVSVNATSPAVCGLFRPVILVPDNLASSLDPRQLHVVLLHELAHIKRADLWVNLIQTILQILYFYNPLLWLANAIIRRAREQAVDETVLVSMGEHAEQYPQTLVDVAKLAFERPALSLRLIGVVESKGALSGRIKRILNRPIPKTAKLGIIGLLVIGITAVILIPMAKSEWSDENLLIRFGNCWPPGPIKTTGPGDKATWSTSHDVKFKEGEELLVVAELYQAGKPMRVLGRKIFQGSTNPDKLSVHLTRVYGNEAKTVLVHSAKVQLGDQILDIPEFTVKADRFYYGEGWGRYGASGLRKERYNRTGQDYARLESLFYWFNGSGGDPKEGQVLFWIPGHRTTQTPSHHHIQFSMVPLSRQKYLIDGFYTAAGRQGLDGKTIPEDLSYEQAKAMANQYFTKLTMPLPELTAHKYYKAGEVESIDSGETVNGITVRLGGSKPLGLFFTNNTLWYEVTNRSTETIEFNQEPYAQKGTLEARSGYLEISDINGEAVEYEWNTRKELWNLKPGRNYKVHSFVNGRPLRKSGPGTYKARVTLVVRGLESGKTFEVTSNWHPFEVTPCGYPPDFVPETAYEQFRQAEAYHPMVGFGHATVEEIIHRYEAIIEKYPNSKYELESHFGIAKAASENRDPSSVTEDDYALSRRHYQAIIRKWPDVVTTHTIHARNHAYFRTAEFKQSRRDLYQWLTSLTAEQKTNSMREYFIWSFEPSDEDVHRAVKSFNKVIAAHISRLEQDSPLGEDDTAWGNPVEIDVEPDLETDVQVDVREETEIFGRVVDEKGNPVPDAQVALCTENIGVMVSHGKLKPLREDVESRIVRTDSEGMFDLGQLPTESFDVIVAHDKGFAKLVSGEYPGLREIQIQPWGRIEGQVAKGRYESENKIWMSGLPNSTWFLHECEYRYETACNTDGRFAFEHVPAGWFEVGYLIRTGDSSWSITSRTPVEVQSGETANITLGGSGRPVVGTFVPPDGYDKAIYFGNGLRSLDTTRPEKPHPDNYDRMTRREQEQWWTQWRKTDQYKQYRDANWHDPNWRQYTFRINDDGSFRIEDVIAGTYDLTVWLQERLGGGGPMEEIASYYGTIEVPQMPGGRSDEPLDLGELVLVMHDEPLHVGDVAPLFENKTLDGNDVHLMDYRGNLVLLSFWQPVSHPEIGRLRELYDTYHSGGQLQIIGLGGHDTLEEVRQFVEQNNIPWPQIYTGEEFKSRIAKDYRIPGLPWIFLIDPDGKIAATGLRGEELKSIVSDAIEETNNAKLGMPKNSDNVEDKGKEVNKAPKGNATGSNAQTLTYANLFDVARAANYKVGPEWFRVAESADHSIYIGAERLVESDDIETVGSPPRRVNKWLLRLINLDDPAGEKFRAEYRDIVVRFADTWAESFMGLNEFNPPSFLRFDSHKGRHSFAWRYWPAFSSRTDKVPYAMLGSKLVRKFSYLRMLEPFTTTQMYFDCWVRALDELEDNYLDARTPLRNLPAHRKHALAEMLFEEINERLKKIEPDTTEDHNLWKQLLFHKTLLRDFLDTK